MSLRTTAKMAAPIDRDRATRLAHVAALERSLARWGSAHALLVASLTLVHNRVMLRSCVRGLSRDRVSPAACASDVSAPARLCRDIVARALPGCDALEVERRRSEVRGADAYGPPCAVAAKAQSAHSRIPAL